MMQEPFFTDKRILVIDQSPKKANDRTWCFWEKEAGLFESIVYHRWELLDFFSAGFSATLSIQPYQYKMIRGIDLYEMVRKAISRHTNIEWRKETVKILRTETDKAWVETDRGNYTADYVFNSILFADITRPLQAGEYHLLQHFKGWVIETEEPVFDPARAGFMDFRVDQSAGTTFLYTLPTSPTTALVEYTLFTEQTLQPEAYDKALRLYVGNTLSITNYRITHEETGIIPMTNHVFPLQEGRIVQLGIAGGQVKGSSGYAFRFIQKKVKQVVDSLVKNGRVHLRKTWRDQKFHLYDSVLLHVLQKRKLNGDAVFAMIFQHNPPQRVLRFLDNETNILEDLQIMRSVPARIFLPAALKELLS